MRKLIFILFLVIRVSICNAASVKPAVDSVYICNSKASHAYHAYVCSGLAHCKHGILKVNKAYAIRMGYKPCKICY